MNNVSANLNVYFEEPNWICEYLRKTGDDIEICKIIFDFEPLPCDIYKYFLNNFNNLTFQKSEFNIKNSILI